MDTRPRLVWFAAIVPIALVALIAAPAFLARAQSVSDPVPLVEPDNAAIHAGHSPFELYPIGAGAISYEQAVPESQIQKGDVEPDRGLSPAEAEALSAEPREAFEGLEAWSEINHDVNVRNAWSRYTDESVLKAQAERARREAGLVGLDAMGVE